MVSASGYPGNCVLLIKSMIMKKTITLLFLLICTARCAMTQTPGQPIKGVIVKGGKNPGGNMLLSFGAGINNPGSKIKENTFISNGFAVNGNLYVPLFARDGNLAGKTAHFFTLGINAGGEYLRSNKDYSTNAYPPYQITGQSSAPAISVQDSGSPKIQGFKAEAGVQANFSFGPMTISPILNGGYMRIDQKAFEINQNSSVNGKMEAYHLYRQSAAKTNGFAFTPKLRLAYFPGRVGIYVEGNYTLGPDLKTETSVFTPQGAADPKTGSYSIDQMLTGTNRSEVKTNRYSGLGLNFGISLPLGKSINEKGIKRTMADPQSKSIREKGVKRTAIQNEETTGDGFQFSAESLPVKLLNSRQDPCLNLISPKNGSSYSSKQDLEIKADLLNPGETGKASFVLYKISSDKDFWFKAEAKVREKYRAADFLLPNSYTEEIKNTGFSPLTIDAGIKGNQVAQIIEKGKLTEGSYKLVFNPNNGCAQAISNFSINSSNCTHAVRIKSVDCIGNADASGNSKYRVCVDYTNTSNPGCTNCEILLNHANNYAGGPAIVSLTPGTTVSNISAVPPSLLAGQSTVICFDAAVTSGSNLEFAVLGTCKDGLETSTFPNHENELFNEVVKACICDICSEIEFELKKQTTASLSGNSVNITEPVSVFAPNPAVGQVVAVKAEIISFERYVGEECMSCDKTSSQWGNFNAGTYAGLNGALGTANNGVTGNTTHSMYWNASSGAALPAAASFNLNISLPPLSNLRCCCDQVVITIRYTYSFKDKETGICKMCSFIRKYTLQKGNCPIIKNPGTPVKVDVPNIKNF
mgnify:CR=1 FL=1